MFVLAHHDDEVFCAGHLLDAIATGRRLRILWATAGALCHIAGIAGAPEDLLDAAVAHGDGEAPLVYVPAYEGGHPDHAAVSLAVAVLRSRRPEIAARESPLYRRGPAGLSVQAPPPAPRCPERRRPAQMGLVCGSASARG